MTLADLVGSWRLTAAHLLRDGAPTDEPSFGRDPTGFIHYLPDGRMMVMIAHEGRRAPEPGAPDADLLKEARTFTAYGGTYELAGEDHVVHHVDISSAQAGVGCDYVRRVRLDGDELHLITPDPIPIGRPMRLVWRRLLRPDAPPKAGG
jgi:hypothetical protein